MMHVTIRLLLACIGAGALVVTNDAPADAACTLERCPTPGLGGGDATIELSGAGVGAIVAGSPAEAVDYIWRLRDLCVIADETEGACSPMDFQACPQEPGRIVRFLVVQRRAVVRSDGT